MVKTPKILIPEGIEEHRERFLRELKKEKSVILYHDTDPDGIVAGALLEGLLERLGIEVKSRGISRYEIRFDPGRSYILSDIRLDSAIASQLKENGARLYYVDHHEPDEVPERVVYFNPWLMGDVEFPVRPYAYNTALLAWILEGLSQKHEWKVAAAHFTDHAEDDHTREWMEEMRKKYGKETIERVGVFLSLAQTFPDEISYDEMREIVKRAKTPEDVLKNERLRSLWEIYQKEFKEWLERTRKATKEENVVYLVIEGVKSRKLRNAVATVASDEFPGKVFVIGQREGDYVDYSLRFQGYEKHGVHLGEVAREAGEKFGGRGGGHPPAAGLRIPVEKEEEFREWIKERLRGLLRSS